MSEFSKQDTVDDEPMPDWGTLHSIIQEASSFGESDASIYDELEAIDIRYFREEPINAGAVKEIIRTDDRRTGRPIAMAVLLDETNPDSVENFLREARLTAYLQHPNIVPVYDVGLDKEKKPFFTMKLLSGENLGSVIKKLARRDLEFHEKFGLAELLEIFTKVCDAVAYAHAAGIIHLDLKPENIHLSNYGEVRVCDWGLAKIANSDCEGEASLLDDETLYASCVNNLTIDGFLKGTPGYMAPEQARGGQAHKDERTDVYSLGSILYAILCHACPIEGKDMREILENTKKGFFKPPRKRAPKLNIPMSLEAVVMKAMATNPADRYQRVDEMIEDVDAYRNGFATQAEGAGFGTQFRLLMKRNPKVFVTIFSTLAVIAALVAFYTSRLKISEREARQATADYIREREWRTQREAAPDYYNRAYEQYLKQDFVTAARLTRIALDYDKNLYRAWELKGNIDFSNQQYGEALEAFTNAGTPSAKGWSYFTKKMAELQKKYKNKIPVNEMLKILRSNRNRRSIHLRNMIGNYLGTLKNETEQFQFISGYLKSLSRNPKNFKMTFTPIDKKDLSAGWAVDISKNGKDTLELMYLKGLPITHLNASESNLKNLDQLKYLPLKQLNLSGATGFGNIDPLSTLELEKLDLSNLNISRITSIRNMPLEELNLTNCPRIDNRMLSFIKDECRVKRLILSKEKFPDKEAVRKRVGEKIELVLK